jgi:DNA end-binding protein Ku
MPARAIASGTISFGLVSIPVKLFSASESSAGISFNMLHGTCRSRLKQQYICSKDNEIVPRDQMVKGYEFQKDQYVVFTEEELKALSRESTRSIEIAEFVPAAKVDPLYFDHPYYLGPDKGGEKAYHLLAQAMTKTARSAIASWTTRGRQHLVLVRAVPGGLMLHQLKYAAEVRPIAEVQIPGAAVKAAELDLAVQFIEQLKNDKFEPEKYKDEVVEQMRAAIEQKVQGQEVVAAPEAPRGQIIDLMEALKASLQKNAGQSPAVIGAPAAPAEEPAERKPAKRAPRAPGESTRRAAKG